MGAENRGSTEADPRHVSDISLVFIAMDVVYEVAMNESNAIPPHTNAIFVICYIYIYINIYTTSYDILGTLLITWLSIYLCAINQL